MLNKCENKLSSLFRGFILEHFTQAGMKRVLADTVKPLRTQQQQRIVGRGTAQVISVFPASCRMGLRVPASRLRL